MQVCIPARPKGGPSARCAPEVPVAEEAAELLRRQRGGGQRLRLPAYGGGRAHARLEGHCGKRRGEEGGVLRHAAAARAAVVGIPMAEGMRMLGLKGRCRGSGLSNMSIER